MAAKTKFYVVWKGRQTGIFTTWEACAAQVNGYTGAQYKAFESRAAAEAAYASTYSAALKAAPAPSPLPLTSPPEATPRRIYPGMKPNSYCVDAACSGNPGRLEFRCVDFANNRVVFHEGPFQKGTNNIGEFLAIVQALQLLHAAGDPRPIYTDSTNAMLWVRKKHCNTHLTPSTANRPLFERIAQAEAWLKENAYKNPILKWDTQTWGEIPADFGRK